MLGQPYHQEKAFEECPFGFFFLAATQLVGAAGMGTSNMPPFSKLMDEVVSTLPFVQVSTGARVRLIGPSWTYT